jgi:tetratricopeptide (TPR) repeat protein
MVVTQRRPGAPDPVSVKLREINELVRNQHLEDADRQIRKLMEQHPNRADVHTLRGLVYIAQKKRHLAVPHFEFAVKSNEYNPVFLNNLGRLYLDLDLVELALPFLDRALKINPREVDTMWAIGGYFANIGQAERSLPYLEKAVSIDPSHAQVALARASSFEAVGRTQEAIEAYSKLVSKPGLSGQALDRLSELESHDVSSPLMAEITDQISKATDPKGLNALHTGAGRIYDRSKDYDRAFEHFKAANDAIPLSFDIDRFRNWTDSVIATLDAAFFEQRKEMGVHTDLPVFVVGMPRSGTTLTEQIIASHGHGGGAGEVLRIARFGQRFQHNKDIARFVRQIDELGAKTVRELGQNYLDLLRFLVPDKSRVVDKMPHNFMMLGFIAMLFPGARVIHARRNAVDTCWSCYQNRLNDGHRYSRDLRTLGLYYREYLRLMEHWKKVLPLRIYESNYEELTADPEVKARELIDFIGLEWDPACLKFHEARSTVRTISLHQVRQPVNTKSVERWRRYEKHLGPLLEALGDAAH